ncbi:hypothetical protein BJX70DRAFT_401500 [Aspergillus crustosus]
MAYSDEPRESDDPKQATQVRTRQRRRRTRARDPATMVAASPQEQDTAVQPYARNKTKSQEIARRTRTPSTTELSRQADYGNKQESQPQEQKKEEDTGLKLRLDLNLDLEIELKARIHGDLTLALL